MKWTQWIYVQMPGQDLEYYQIEPDPCRAQGTYWTVEQLRSLFRTLKSLGIL
jgi:hypothetical protein